MSDEDQDSDPHECGDRAVARLAGGQYGALSYDQGRACGLTRQAINTRVTSGRWEALLPRVYRVGGAPASGRQACMAATLWAGEGSLVSHRAAGVLWGLDGVMTRRVELTVARDVDRRCAVVVVHRTGLLRPSDVSEIGAIPVTSPVRTLVDLAADVRPRELELAVEDAFRRRLASPDELTCALDELGGPGRRGCGALRRLLEQRDGRSESGWEVRLRRLLVEHGLPTPAAQHEVIARGRSYRLDLAYPASKVALEFDSLRWHTGRGRLESDSMRRNLLRDAGWHLVHVTARMLRERPEHVVALVRSAVRGDASHEKRD